MVRGAHPGENPPRTPRTAVADPGRCDQQSPARLPNPAAGAVSPKPNPQRGCNVKTKPNNPARRRAMKLMLGGAMSIPLASLVTHGTAIAADMPQLAESDPLALSLKYKHDASQAPRVDKAGTPAAEQVCGNCQFAQGDGEWVGCTIFPGKAVNTNGWCTAWVKRAG